MELGNRARELWAQVRLRRCEMAGALRLILTLAKLQYGIEGETAEVLDAFVSPDALDARETAWEQVTQASVAWALAREEGGFATAPSLTDAIEDTAELKKLIAAFMDRVKEAPDKIREL